MKKTLFTLLSFFIGGSLFLNGCEHTNLEEIAGSALELSAMMSPNATPQDAFMAGLIGGTLRKSGERKYYSEEEKKRQQEEYSSYVKQQYQLKKAREKEAEAKKTEGLIFCTDAKCNYYDGKNLFDVRLEEGFYYYGERDETGKTRWILINDPHIRIVWQTTEKHTIVENYTPPAQKPEEQKSQNTENQPPENVTVKYDVPKTQKTEQPKVQKVNDDGELVFSQGNCTYHTNAGEFPVKKENGINYYKIESNGKIEWVPVPQGTIEVYLQ
jgi:hypothetical protein